MHEARQTFCLDLFSMFHKICIFVSLCKLLNMKSVPACIIRILRLILKPPQGEISDKKSVHNILDIIHSSNLVLRSGGGGGGSGVYFFLEDICDIVLGIFDTKIKQHMISTDSIDSITKIN